MEGEDLGIVFFKLRVFRSFFKRFCTFREFIYFSFKIKELGKLEYCFISSNDILGYLKYIKNKSI